MEYVDRLGKYEDTAEEAFLRKATFNVRWLLMFYGVFHWKCNEILCSWFGQKYFALYENDQLSFKR